MHLPHRSFRLVATALVLLSACVHAPALELTGVVSDPEGRPLPDAAVNFLLTWADGMDYRLLTTDADGGYHLSDLRRGPLTVQVVSAVGWADLGDVAIPHAAQSLSLPVLLTQGPTLEVEVRGLQGRPAPGIEFGLFGPGYYWPRNEGKTDAQGRAVFRNLLPGPYELTGACRSSRVFLGPRDLVRLVAFTAEERGADAPPAEAAAAETEAPPLRLPGVVCRADGSPVAGVKVYLDLFPFDFLADILPIGPVETDAQGVFGFANVPAGYHWAIAVAGGRPVAYVPFHAARTTGREPLRIALPSSLGRLEGTVVDAATGQGVADADLVLARRQPTDGTLWRSLYDVDLDQADAAQQARDQAGAPKMRPSDVCARVKTQQDGRFIFEDIVPEEYTLVAKQGGRRATRAGIVPEPGETAVVPPLRLARTDGLFITGSIVHPDGSPVTDPGMSVAAFAGPTGYGGQMVVSDPEGKFAIPISLPGWYALSLQGPVLSHYTYWGALASANGRPQPVTIVVPDAGAGAAVTVRVVGQTGRPPQGATWLVPLQVKPPDQGVGCRPRLDLLAYPDASGTSRIEGLPPGRYRFLARTTIGPESADTPMLQGISDEIEILPGDDTAAAVVLEPGIACDGVVRHANGDPAAGRPVLALAGLNVARLWADQFVAVTDSDGRFRIGNVPAGAWALASPGDLLDWQAGGGLTTATDINVAPGQEKAVEITLPEAPPPVVPSEPTPTPEGAVVGQVVYAADGSPAPGASVALREGGWRGLPPQVLTDAAGRFTLPLPLGRPPSYIIAWAPGYAEAWSEVTAAGAEGGGIALALQRGATLAGRVVLPTGDVAEGDMRVIATSPAETRGGRGDSPDQDRRVTRDGGWAVVWPDGTFRIGHLRPVPHAVHVAWGSLCRSAPETIELTEGAEVSGLDLAAAPLEPLVGATVTYADGVTPMEFVEVAFESGNEGLPLYGLRTSRDGRIEVHNVPHGTYSVVVHTGGPYIRNLGQLGDFVVEPGASEFLLAAQSLYAISGRVASDGPLPPGLRVVATYERDPLTRSLATAAVGEDGFVSLIVPGEWTYTVHLLMGQNTLIGSQQVTLKGALSAEFDSLRWPGDAPGR